MPAISPNPAPLLPPPALRALKGAPFPADLRMLKLHALERGADDDILLAINGMPARTYTSMREVNAALGIHESVEGRENIWSAAPSQELEDEGDFVTHQA